jgi:hypothetical protein
VDSAPALAPLLLTPKRNGTKDSPIALTSDGEEDKPSPSLGVEKRKRRYLTVVEGGKKKKIVDVVRQPSLTGSSSTIGCLTTLLR